MTSFSQNIKAGQALDEGMFALGEKYNLNKVESRFLGPLLKYFEEPGIRELVINKPGEVGYEYPDGSWKWVEAPELTAELLDDAARMLANRTGQLFTPTHPVLSCKMPGGHRLQVVSGHHAQSKFTLTVRINHKKGYTINNYDMSADDKAAIINAVQTRKTILISGGTSTGKTSFMNALVHYIPEHERLITLEDVPELDIPHKNWASLIFAGANADPEGKQIKEILNATLRMRPDRILLGEIRKENAFAFCSAINTGHEGSMATIHANSPQMALDAVVNRVMLNGDIPESALTVLRRQLTNDIYGVVQLTRDGDKVKGRFEVLNANANIGSARQT